MPKPTKKPEPKDELQAALDAMGDGETELPDLDAQLAAMDAVNPLEGLKKTGDAEVDAKAVVSATLAAFKAQAKNEAKTFQDNTDSEFWFAVSFQNREQKEEFLKAVGWFAHGDKYLDGDFVASKMGVKLSEANPRFITNEVEKSMVSLGIIGE